jgi:hypothetical protein
MANVVVDTVFAPLKAAGETIQKLLETRDAVKIGEAKATLLAQISAAYNTAAAIQVREAELRVENESLKRRLMERESLGARKARYELKTLPPGVVICSLKQGMDAASDPQEACHYCYENGKISALHRRGMRNGVDILYCQGCGSELKIGQFEPPPAVPYRSRIAASRFGGSRG